MNTRELQQHLRNFGWPISVDGVYGPITKKAVWEFQRGFAFYYIHVDGIPGPQTYQAINKSNGKADEHFSFVEFKSNGNGWISLHRVLVDGLEKYRQLVGGPVRIVSGYRDPAYNRKIGGASRSQHLYGAAADIPAVVHLDRVKELRVFTGIGYNPNGLVRHVDIRPGNVNNPVTWRY